MAVARDPHERDGNAAAEAPVVIDLGSETVRSGLAGDLLPRFRGRTNAAGNQDNMPVDRGQVVGWDAVELLLRHAIDSAGGEGEDRPLLLTEAIHNPREIREKMAELCFEGLGVPALSLVARPLASLYAQQVSSSGSPSMSGLVVTVGDHVQTHVPILDGRARLREVVLHECAGGDLTDYMVRLLAAVRPGFLERADAQPVAKEIKETRCFVSEDFDSDVALEQTPFCDYQESFSLPGGQLITIGSVRCRCPEALFQPTLLEMSGEGIHETAFRVIRRFEDDVRPALWENIVLSGGSTRFPNFRDRLQKELASLLPDSAKVEVRASEFGDQTFAGASLLAASPHFASIVLSRERWGEEGAAAIHSACPHGDLAMRQGPLVKAAREG
jgi:actin, other eukaryote